MKNAGYKKARHEHPTCWDIKVRTLTSKSHKTLWDFVKGKKLIIIMNVTSKDEMSLDQYKMMVDLYTKYKD